ncbi:SPOR domain-containing protein [Halomonas pacifica]|uniref:SPOR domain-containing protein n=1 Tax=Bisbaumannia pacifica TaxID=77098 RepID=UPI0023590090|nr:SPOR domain-containing protein [Halomonas pacifica]MDC8803999.1 SPOR domain-containing protein [Halomonas pacifica]
MKYGMRERLSGAVILIALGVIFVPMLFDEPAPREERPQPVLTIEQPIEVDRTPVEEPTPPASLGEVEAEGGSDGPSSPGGLTALPEAPAPAASEPEVVRQAPEVEAPAEPEPQPAPEPEPREPASDPIAELARAAQSGGDARPAVAGDWAVQAGSFGEPANAERLERQLSEQGFRAYRRPRDNGLTTVYVGPFESSEAGERARGELKDRANIQGLLIRVRE